MITVADVAHEPSLNLQVVAGAGGLQREVRSAHVSELTAPGDWLRGGELLMTVGPLLPMRLPECRAYLSECAAAGVAALALGLGHGLPYQDCPAPLRIAAEESGVPLMMVPDETPFIAVTRFCRSWYHSHLAVLVAMTLRLGRWVRTCACPAGGRAPARSARRDRRRHRHR
jgi:PucR family transcriptional regulator, purine catabolism regulatory protein